MSFIYQLRAWPEFEIDFEQIGETLERVTRKQGALVGKLRAAGFPLQEETLLHVLTSDLIKSSEIEGELLATDEVRSSIARKLGMEIGGLIPSDRHVDGLVEMLLDATQKCDEPLTKERLFGWHSTLFPTGYSGTISIKTGEWRDDRDGPMQVVSGALGRERVHFKAPDAAYVSDEMERFLQWFNASSRMAPVIKAAIAHFWFVTIHPFDDGNGRIARAIADMLLTRSEGMNQRYYSMSAQIRKERNAYYSILEKSQRGDLDITPWIEWFLNCLYAALEDSEAGLETTFQKSNFWEINRHVSMNERQTAMVNRLLDGFVGKLTSSKWAKICKCSPDTALRDINDLIAKEVLVKDQSGGRSTAYLLK
ncbi:MAG: cell filamentation protein Fic [Candidatus Fluviicola riflensis]|nr:MAG: cell filamentation protein Fic [Candidatus Fluviicola riflensis]OGS79042.1 MAG: cell filamentation protein Fic [Candidatus Fluviicola riflensis]OGS86065.1 MAG: cell filamentation protein Fic [Fluviicola sp. RIFCSPHIGHO2_12_FULL_43_24]OGS86474.1 MAG: cell filamentation protein Fic [Fluviicola sp. RIFCSPHIGHO2_01_FULL_43_53]